MGLPWSEAVTAGMLLGTKTALNDLIAYLDLSRLPDEALSARSRLIVTYALCGFANFASIGIQIGGISPLAPERRPDLARLAPRAMLGGAFASWMTATIAGMFL